ncbi:PD-(D/E)XK nuclease family protein [Nitrosospira sp. NpAV]|uniref:PD-(D/E)XK nuclease family protein n=1 Tax=Nitrosospira sp. NpAV TaxID=58133 RepID=UPI0005A23204|nr:PD-(D/E)XK nuclease family protein [Nitrosospira sp. NpAV]KIO50171.1 DNA repair protein [Nitrosospira sp. NpAV]
MFPILNFPQAPLSNIFADLAVGLKAGLTVITPNRRLAIALKREFDECQAARGIAAWHAADILPFSTFIERLYEEAFYSGQAPELPVLLTPAQEQILWEDAIRRSDTGGDLLAIGAAARLAREAWQLANAWQLVPLLKNFSLNEDCKAFQDWSQCYEKTTRRAQQIDRTRLCDLVSELCEYAVVSKPKRLACYGFDIVTPQQAALLIKLEKAGCEVMRVKPQLQLRSGNAGRVVCDNSDDEIRRAAVWARARIEADGTARIGVVVPEFSKYRSAITRIFSSVMEPDVQQSLPGTARRMLPFNVSLGMALSAYPLVSAAFLILDLSGREMEFAHVSLLLRSPFLDGAESEMVARAQLDAQLRKRAEPMITLERLLLLIERDEGEANCPILVQRLAALAEFRKAALSRLQTPSAWARVVSEALRIAGFPGERVLDSSEYQILEKWHEVLADFATLGSVVSRMGYSDGVSRLRRMAAETQFQPRTPDVPIQILGVLEAAGMGFDYLWVMGLSNDIWPLQPSPSPFLPIELQRAASLPRGSAVASMELAQRFTDAWLSSADEIILSHSRHGDDHDTRELAPSPMIANIAVRELVLPVYASHRDLIHNAGRLERITDDKAPAIDLALTGMNSDVSGGTAVIRDHAACPFRALAMHRFGAESMRTPHTGLDAMERGTLVHHVLAQVWNELKTKSRLDTISDDSLESLLMHAADKAIARVQRERPDTLLGRFAEIERRRLVRLARAWLDEEKARGGYTVIAIEDKRSIDIGGLRLSTCLDRVDEFGDGRRIIIDYKTRAPSVNAMLGARPEEPQLPLYLVAAEPAAVAVAFAQVKMGDTRFAALVRDSDVLPGVKMLPESRLGNRYRSWEELVGAWRTDLTRIAISFSSGDAQVDPREFPHTCRNCDLRSICRIDERMETLFTGQEDEE